MEKMTMKYYKLFITETNKKDQKEEYVEYKMFKDEPSIEERIANYKVLISETEKTEVEITWEEIACDEYVAVKEKEFKEMITKDYEWENNATMTVREYNIWKKSLTEQDKKDIYASALMYHLEGYSLSKRMQSVLDITKINANEYLEMIYNLKYAKGKEKYKLYEKYLAEYPHKKK